MKINRTTNNFDFLRLLFSLTVAVGHAEILSGISMVSNVSQYLNSEVAVDSFFVISGFLIFMSFESSQSIINYINKRIRRIFPGYITVILLSSILLSFISSNTFYEYFNIEFIKYVLFNILTLNFLHPGLPGVFENNYMSAINGALWTIKIEVMFYILVPFISIIISKYRSHKLLILISIYMLSVIYSLVMLWLYSREQMDIFITLEKQIPGQLAFFISGGIIYYFYDYFYNRSSLLLILAIAIIFIHKDITDLYILYPAALSIIVIYLATIFKYIGNWGRFGDLSFGVYIWHFPIIQVFIYCNLFSNPIMGSIILFITILTAAYFSWHLVEKRFLYRSSHYITSEKERND